jgi:hypothetical protein
MLISLMVVFCLVLLFGEEYLFWRL